MGGVSLAVVGMRRGAGKISGRGGFTQLMGIIRYRGAAVLALLVVAAGVAIAARFTLLGPDAAQETLPPIPDPGAVYDPVDAGERLPPGYRVALPRDAITPVYRPVFTPAANVDWPDDSLVIGVSGPETAKAYPVTHLNSREMVIDWLDDTPILVSW